MLQAKREKLINVIRKTLVHIPVDTKKRHARFGGKEFRSEAPEEGTLILNRSDPGLYWHVKFQTGQALAFTGT